MNPSEYVRLAKLTDVNDYVNVARRLKIIPPEVLHAVMGITSESGEFADAVKKHLFYGKPLDGVNLIEECGDLLWYIAILCDYFDYPMEAIMQKNIEKLRARYPNKFTEADALNRNLDNERKILEG